MNKVIMGFLMLCCCYAVPVPAATIDVLIGDNDGFGSGTVGDNESIAVFLSQVGPSDNREPDEVAATNGAQFTDFYFNIFPSRPDPDGSALLAATTPAEVFASGFTNILDIIFPFSGELDSASVVVDIGDFQQQDQLNATINGFAVPFVADPLFAETSVQSFALSQDQLADANSKGSVELQIVLDLLFAPGGGAGSGDLITFDFFQLLGESDVAPTAVPAPGSLLLMLFGICAFVGIGRTKAYLCST